MVEDIVHVRVLDPGARPALGRVQWLRRCIGIMGEPVLRLSSHPRGVLIPLGRTHPVARGGVVLGRVA